MKIARPLLALVAAVAAACGSDRHGNPARPALGAQIDRMGRAAVNTALTNPFGLTPTTQTPDQTKDAYNAASDPATWVASWKGPIAGNLAVLDSLDATCGNQLLAKAATGGTVPADRYAPLAAILADDRLFLRTDKTTCAAYLAVEATAAGVAGFDADCGGRTPLEDTIDETYSLLAIGAVSGVTDGIAADADQPPSLAAFPFLGAPNP